MSQPKTLNEKILEMPKMALKRLSKMVSLKISKVYLLRPKSTCQVQH